MANLQTQEKHAPNAMSVYSANAITPPTTNQNDRIDPDLVGEKMDAYQLARGLDVLPRNTHKLLAQTWAKWLTQLGIKTSQIGRVFATANRLKENRFELDWSDIRKGALVVIGQVAEQEHARAFAEGLADWEDAYRQRQQLQQAIRALPPDEFNPIYQKHLQTLVETLGQDKLDQFWTPQMLTDYAVVQEAKQRLESSTQGSKQ